ncbi:sulfotransferase [Thalassotalea psychrophila]|uniref:Sulfotransferase n=1 Tax=Thalassotalea psychrophila TaxID=3065647 RepID=A0ABY9U570_9GAMM|nr:sulfotransferase [Colwelliaceae bacterium SQ149]
MSTTGKIFIIGLPRTATTSICVAMLDLGFKVAHTCYTFNCLQNAQVIADAPVFYHFKELDLAFPNSKFIYLERDLADWIPSIQQLLLRMHTNVARQDGGFNPIIKQSYTNIFNPFSIEKLKESNFLEQCYLDHKRNVEQYFKNRPNDLLHLNVASQGSYQELLNFLNLPANDDNFVKINIGGKVTFWKDIKHPNKIESTNKGRIDKHLLRDIAVGILNQDN